MRMMRAVEFASRLGFAITPDAYEAILRHRKEIVKSAPPRVTEELAQSLRGGHALPTLLLLREVGLLDVLLPELAAVLRQIDPDHAARRPGTSSGRCSTCWTPSAGAAASSRTPCSSRCSFCRSCARACATPRPSGEPDLLGLSTIIEDVVSPLAFRMSLPRAATDRIKQALSIVGKLSHRPDGKLAARRLAFRDAFGTALDIFELTAMATGRGQELVRDWRAPPGQDRSAPARPARSRPLAAPPPPRRRRAGRRRAARPGRGPAPAYHPPMFLSLQLPRHPSRRRDTLDEEPRRDPAGARTSAPSPTASARRTARTAILEASHYVELYDDELDEEVYKVGVHTLPAWLPDNMEPEACVAGLEKVVARACSRRTASS